MFKGKDSIRFTTESKLGFWKKKAEKNKEIEKWGSKEPNTLKFFLRKRGINRGRCTKNIEIPLSVCCSWRVLTVKPKKPKNVA